MPNNTHKPKVPAAVPASPPEAAPEAAPARDLALEVRELTRAWSIRRTPKVHAVLTEASRALVGELLARGAVHEALPHQQRLAALQPDDMSAAAELCRLLWLTGNVAAAATGMAKLSREAPADAGRRRALAALRLAQGLTDVAQTKLDEDGKAPAKRGAPAGPAWAAPLLRALTRAIADDLPADALILQIREERPAGVPSSFDALLATLSTLLARDARAALDGALTASPPLPGPVEEGLIELAVIALLRGRDSRGLKAVDAVDATRLELLAAHPERVPERIRAAVGRALVDAERPAGALGVLAAAPLSPEVRAHRAAALQMLGRDVEARVERLTALSETLNGRPSGGAVPAWFPAVLGGLTDLYTAPSALKSLIARIRTRFPDATLAERLNTVAGLTSAKSAAVLDQSLRFLKSHPRPDPLAVAAAVALGDRPTAALDILDRLAASEINAANQGPRYAARVAEVFDLALHRLLDQRSPERARPYLERRLAAGGDAVWALYMADLDEHRQAGTGRAQVDSLLARANGDARASAECAEIALRAGDAPLAVRFIRQVDSLDTLSSLEAARAVTTALAAGDHTLGWRHFRARLAREIDDDARVALIGAVVSMLVDSEVARVVPECEELAALARSLGPRDGAVAKAIADLAAAKWGQERGAVDTADKALQHLRAHEATLTDRWIELERRALGDILRSVVEGVEVSTKDPVLAPRRPATANRVVRQALIAYVAAHLPPLAPYPRPAIAELKGAKLPTRAKSPAVSKPVAASKPVATKPAAGAKSPARVKSAPRPTSRRRPRE